MSIKLPNGKEIKLWDVKFVEPDWKAPDGYEVIEVTDPAEVERMASVLEGYALVFEHAVLDLAKEGLADSVCVEKAQRARSHARSATRTRLVKVEVR